MNRNPVNLQVNLTQMNRTIIYLYISIVVLLPAHLFAVVLSNDHLVMHADEATGRIQLFLPRQQDSADRSQHSAPSLLSEQGWRRAVSGRDRAMLESGTALLFADQPPSGFTLIRTGEELAVFGGHRGTFIMRPEVRDGILLTEWENGEVRVSRAIRLVYRKQSGTQDGALITFTLRSKSSEELQVGARLLIDTYLGERGNIHFRLSDGQNVESETSLSGQAQIPRAWISSDPGSVETCVRGVLRGPLATTPTRVVFANYRSLRQSGWDYEVDPGNKFHHLPYSRNDSAVALFYGPVTLGPGEEVSFSTILGLCGDEEYALQVQRIAETETEPTPVTEEVVEEEPQAEPEPEEPEDPAPGPEPPTQVQLTPREVRQVKRELRRIRKVRGSLKEINRILDEINNLLSVDEKSISKEQLSDLIEELERNEL